MRVLLLTLAAIGLFNLTLALLATVLHVQTQWRYRRWLRTIPRAERLDLDPPIPVHQTARIDWPLGPREDADGPR